MTVLEKAARAIVAAEQDEWELPAEEWDYETLERHGILRQARAVLMAVREPDEEARRQGWNVLRQKNDIQTRLGNSLAGVESPVFTAMIDAILSEPQP